MIENSSKKENKGIWMSHEVSLTPYGCAKLFERNEPLERNLVRVFSYLIEKFFILCNRKEGIHLFINHQLDEVHYIYRRFGKEMSTLSYNGVKDTKLREWFKTKQLVDLKETGNVPQIANIEEDDLKSLLKSIGFENPIDYKYGLILPFDYGEVNLGRFIIWGERNLKRKGKEASDHVLLGGLAAGYSFLSKFLCREYRVNNATYLPSYYSAGWKQVAILFADIRNFTPMTEMLRNAYSKRDDPGPLRQIINGFCSEMANIIQEKNRGRIDKFLGDGILAIFGEYDRHPSKIVCRGVYVACRMVKVFRDLKKSWQKIAFGDGYELEFNETVEINLGIGIDFGTVLFDYLGDDIHREYSIVGDHVNFAQRLGGEAAKQGEISQKQRPSILISRTAFRCCHPWLNNYTEVQIAPKGKGYEYIVYGIEPEDFNKALFNTSEKNDDWETSWEKDREGSPLLVLSF